MLVVVEVEALEDLNSDEQDELRAEISYALEECFECLGYDLDMSDIYVRLGR